MTSKSINFGHLLTTLSVILYVSYLGVSGLDGIHNDNEARSSSVDNNGFLMEFGSNDAVTLLSDGEIKVIRDDVVNKINRYRNYHNLPDLMVNDEIQQFAQAWADKSIIDKDRSSIGYNPENQLYGETVTFFSSLQHVGEVAVDLWYYQLRFFKGKDTNSIEMEEVINLLSKKTTAIGVGVSGLQNSRINIIVNYYPPGYDENNFEDDLPKITEYDVKLAKTKWQKIYDALKPSIKVRYRRHVSSEFPNGLLPGWESTMYPNEVDKINLQK